MLILWLVGLVMGVIGGKEILWVMGPLLGISLGGAWTAGRVVLLKLTPKGKEGEYFGFYGISNKLAAVIGPLLWGGVVYGLEDFGYGVAYRGAASSVLIMVFIANLVF